MSKGGEKRVRMSKGRLEGSPEEQMFANNWEWRGGFPAVSAALGIKVSE